MINKNKKIYIILLLMLIIGCKSISIQDHQLQINKLHIQIAELRVKIIDCERDSEDLINILVETIKKNQRVIKQLQEYCIYLEMQLKNEIQKK